MKIVDPTSLVPYEVVPLSNQEAIDVCDQRDAGRAQYNMPPMTTTQAINFQMSVAIDRADEAWLRANMPVGAVFDVLGVTHMVVAIGRERAAMGHAWQARVARPDGRGGLEHEDIKVAGLRARVEPAYASGGVVGRPSAS